MNRTYQQIQPQKSPFREPTPPPRESISNKPNADDEEFRYMSMTKKVPDDNFVVSNDSPPDGIPHNLRKGEKSKERAYYSNNQPTNRPLSQRTVTY